MKKLKVVLLSLVVLQLSAQDAAFEQGNASLTILNPSFAGTNGGSRFQTSMQASALGYSGRPTATQASFDAYVKSIKGGIFASFMHDEMSSGIILNNTYNLGYACHFSVFSNKLKIIPSIQGSFLTQKFGYGPRPHVGLVPAGPDTKEAVDLSSGLLVQYRNSVSAGVSVFHINQPDINVSGRGELGRKILVHGAYTLHLNDKRLLQFMTVYSRQSMFQRVKLSSTLVLNHFIAGMGLGSTDPVSFLVGYRHTLFTAQLNHTLSGSKLSETYSSIWELHLSANIRDKEHRHVLTNIENW